MLKNTHTITNNNFKDSILCVYFINCSKQSYAAGSYLVRLKMGLKWGLTRTATTLAGTPKLYFTIISVSETHFLRAAYAFG